MRTTATHYPRFIYAQMNIDKRYKKTSGHFR